MNNHLLSQFIKFCLLIGTFSNCQSRILYKNLNLQGVNTAIIIGNGKKTMSLSHSTKETPMHVLKLN